MSTTFTDLSAQDYPPRKRWTRTEYEEIRSVVLVGQHLELVEGVLITKMGEKPAHRNSVSLLLKGLVAVFGADFVTQNVPIEVSPQDNPSSKPEPDLIVLNREVSHFRSLPQPADLHLVVEVADSTLGFDMVTKASLYARAGIADYWVADIAGRRMIVYRDPQAGRYASILAYAAEESVAPLAAPDSRLRVGDVFLD